MPKAFDHSGYVVGVIGTIILGSIATYCVHILVNLHYVLCKWKKVRIFVTFLSKFVLQTILLCFVGAEHELSASGWGSSVGWTGIFEKIRKIHAVISLVFHFFQSDLRTNRMKKWLIGKFCRFLLSMSQSCGQLIPLHLSNRRLLHLFCVCVD